MLINGPLASPAYPWTVNCIVNKGYKCNKKIITRFITTSLMSFTLMQINVKVAPYDS